MKIGIFYGSTNGNTANAAEIIEQELSSAGQVELKDIAQSDVSEMNDYDVIILGSSTWGIGELQDDWIGKEDLSGVNLSGKKVAVFGTGDQAAFTDSFVNAIGTLADAAEKAGATLIGLWPASQYKFAESAATRGDHLVGLALDEENEPELTQNRIKEWVKQLKGEMM